jgi:hypothetical protein
MRLLLVLLALLLFAAAPAMAQDGTAVGEGQVITDIATETEPPPGEDDGTDIPPVDDGTPAAEPPEPDASGRRGEVHVLDSATESDAPATPAPAPSTSPPATAAASPAAAPARPVAASAKNLPFTGVDAGPLVLIGLALLGAGGGLLAVLRQPVQ